MRALLIAVTVLASARAAVAAPTADVVVYWAADAPQDLRDQVRTAATRAGATFVDRSPTAATPPAAPALLAEAVAAYDALRFEDAVAALDRAAAEIDAGGAAGLTSSQLADVFLFRGLARVQRGDPAAWDDLVISARLDPARVLDPARFPPRAIEQLQRAQRAAVEQARAPLTVHAPAACTVTIDGAPTAGASAAPAAGPGARTAPVIVELAPGVHWVRAACPDHAPWGRRVLLSAPGVAVIAAPAPIAAPTADLALIQARTMGAAAVVDVIVRGGAARARLVRVSDGRELDRVSVTVDGAAAGAPGDQAAVALADAVAALLAPDAVVAPPRWYRSRWVWAAGGALVAAAILVPIAIAGGDGDPEIVVRPTGWPPW